MSQDSNTIDVELRPFKHQVGGHTCVLEICDRAICKPFISKEAWFYDNVPDALRNFIPTHLGETYVTCDIQNDRKCLIASVPVGIVRSECQGRLENDDTALETNTFQPKKKRRRSHRQNDTADNGSALEAWSTTCIDRQINRYGFWANNQPQRFLVLENLVHKYSRPCMMDLKMGRRQYGEDSCDEKRKLLESRCAGTTSVTLGFRICGSQVYDVESSQYICRNKYFGRSLDNDGVVQELTSFFHDGQRVRVDAIRGILKKVNDLKAAMAKQKKFRFHSASLLLMYDAAVTRQTVDKVTGNAVYDVTGNNSDYSGDNTHNSSNEMKDSNCSDDQCKANTRSRTTSKESLERLQPEQSHETSKCDIECIDNDFTELNETKVDSITDIRLIDFAHVSEIPNEANEEISEETISFGLDNLQTILNNISDGN